MRIGVLSQWFDPEPGPASLPGTLARGLVERGHQVRVVTGFPNYPTGVLAPGYRISRRFEEDLHRVAIRRVALYPSHDNSSVRRALNYGSFAASAAALGLGALRGIDALWVNYSPVTVGLPLFVQKALHGTPVVSHVMDLWPDTLFASEFAGQSLGARAAERVLDRWCRWIYRASTQVAYISPGVGGLLRERGVPAGKLAYAPMWADEATFAPRSAPRDRGWGLPANQVVLVYAGTLGGAQGLDTLVRACSKVTHLDFQCLVAGSGVKEAELRQLARDTGAANVRFMGRVSKEEIPDLMSAGDIHYVGLNDHPLAGTTMPSKLQATLASAKPVLGTLIGDAAEVVKNSGGLTTAPGDVEGLAATISSVVAAGRRQLEMRGKQAREYYESEFSARVGIDRIERLLAASATAGRRTA